MNEETILQNKIRAGVSDIAVTFRINVGKFKVGDRYISTGVPPGFSDIFGFRRKDGKAFFIEVKTERGRPTEKQLIFIKKMQDCGALAGIARSVEEARGIIERGKVDVHR